MARKFEMGPLTEDEKARRKKPIDGPAKIVPLDSLDLATQAQEAEAWLKYEKFKELKVEINTGIYKGYLFDFQSKSRDELLKVASSWTFEELKVRPAYALALFHTIFP